MTNINCSSNCVYQKDGKCYFENISVKEITPSNDCAYFLKKENLEQFNKSYSFECKNESNIFY